MPHVYYSIVRFVITAAMIGYLEQISGKVKPVPFRNLFFGVFTLVLFNFIFPIELDRVIWGAIDIILSIIIAISAFKDYKEKFMALKRKD